MLNEILEKYDCPKRDDAVLVLKDKLTQEVKILEEYLEKDKVISFRHEPKGYDSKYKTCFNCQWRIDSDFCTVFLNGEEVGSLCIRCVGKIEENPKKYIKYPYNLNYKNVPTIEGFYRSKLKLSTFVLQLPDDRSFIEENLFRFYGTDDEKISIMDERRPLKENDVEI